MRIGIVLSNTPSYSETFFNAKINGLLKHGLDVRLYCQSKKADFTLCPVYVAPRVSSQKFMQGWLILKEYLKLVPHSQAVLRYIRLERREGSGIFQILKKVYLNAHLLKSKLDWVHFGFATQALGSELVAKAIGAKMAVSFRGFDINVYPIKHPDCYGNLWKHVDKVHTISNYLLKEAYLLGLSKQTPFQCITPAVDIKFIERHVSDNVKKNDVLQIVTIARLHYIKGIDALIETAFILKQLHQNFCWHVIGSGTKNYLERYGYHIYEKGLTDEVILTGQLTHSETISLLNSADLYIQPSLNEGFCNAVLEAQALGKLCIASDTGGLTENIVHQKTGWLVPKNNPEALAKQIEDVHQLSTRDKDEISKNAILRVKNQFNIEKQQQEFIKFYTSLIESKKPMTKDQ